jgi:hypothetical protein
MAYLSASDLKTYIGTTEAGDDSLLTALIASAQAMIDAYCGRSFEAGSDTTRYFDALADVAGPYLYLDRDLCAITSVTNGDGVLVASNEYTTQPRNGATPYYALKLLGSSNKAWTYTTNPDNAITIVGKWAYSTTAPADIIQATRRLARWLYKQRDGTADADRPVTTPDGVTLQPSQIPADIKALLSPHVRRV